MLPMNEIQWEEASHGHPWSLEAPAQPDAHPKVANPLPTS